MVGHLSFYQYPEVRWHFEKLQRLTDWVETTVEMLGGKLIQDAAKTSAPLRSYICADTMALRIIKSPSNAISPRAAGFNVWHISLGETTQI